MMSDTEDMSPIEQKLRGSWAGKTVIRIYGNISDERERQGISAAELSRRCKNLGHPIARAVLAKMDSKDRANISIPELMVIAEALGMAPLDLIYSPYAAGADVERLPGDYAIEQAARDKFVSYDAFKTVNPASETTRLRRNLESWIGLVRESERAIENITDPESSDDYRSFREIRLSRQLYTLQRMQKGLHDHGILTPPLSKGLAEVIEQKKTEIRDAGVEVEAKMSEDGYVVLEDIAMEEKENE